MVKTVQFPASRELFKLARVVVDMRDRGAVERQSDAEIGRYIGFESARTSRWKHGQIAVQDAARLVALSQSLEIDLTVTTHVAAGYLKADEALEILSDTNRLVRFLGEQLVLTQDNQGISAVSDNTRVKVVRRSSGHYKRSAKRIGREAVQEPEGESTVLLVDNSDTTLKYFENLTGPSTGITGVTARTGPEALIAAGKVQPQLVIFDLFIGEVDGFAAVKNIVENRITREAEVIATSLALSPEIIRAARGAGAVDVVQRPLHSRVLTALINRTR